MTRKHERRSVRQREDGHWVSHRVLAWLKRRAKRADMALNFPERMVVADNSEPRHRWKFTGADVGAKRNGVAHG